MLGLKFEPYERFNVALIKVISQKEQNIEASQNNVNHILDLVDSNMTDLKYISITKDNSYILVILSCNAIDPRKTLITSLPR